MVVLTVSATSFFSTYIAPEVRQRLQKDELNAEESGDVPATFKEALLTSSHLEQHGVLRSNCIDCLDRTNVAQFFLSYTVVYRMLFALGIEFAATTPDTSLLQQILVEM